jgi:DNA-binding NarL/FixJ family response regulator
MNLTPKHAEDQAVMILDVMSLRRAGLSSLLAEWAQSCGVTLRSSDLAEDDTVDNCKMLLLSLGNGTLGDPDLMQKIKAMQVKQPEAILVAISDRDDPDEMLRAFQIGFRGFIPTALEPTAVFQVLTFLISGGSFFPPTVLKRFLQHGDITLNGSGQRADGADAAEVNSAHGLTTRQQEVLGLLRRGISNKAIGRELHMSEATVKVHVRQIMRKLGASNRTQAAVIVATDSPKANLLGVH